MARKGTVLFRLCLTLMIPRRSTSLVALQSKHTKTWIKGLTAEPVTVEVLAAPFGKPEPDAGDDDTGTKAFEFVFVAAASLSLQPPSSSGSSGPVESASVS